MRAAAATTVHKRVPARVDVEARAVREHRLSLKLWLRMLACTYRLETEVRLRLKARFSISLARFDLMAQLERTRQGLKMNELSKRMMVTGGNVTGLTDQLAKEGLVMREGDPKDRRACVVKLTPAGRALFNRMAVQHAAWIEELLGGLNQTEKARSYQLLAKLKRHVTDQQEEA